MSCVTAARTSRSLTGRWCVQIIQDIDQQRDALQSELDAKAEAEASLHEQLRQLEQHMQQASRYSETSCGWHGVA